MLVSNAYQSDSVSKLTSDVATAVPGVRTTSRQRNKQTSCLRTSASQYHHYVDDV